MAVKRLHFLEIEIFKIFKQLNWDFITDTFFVFEIQLIRNITFKCTMATH